MYSTNNERAPELGVDHLTIGVDVGGTKIAMGLVDQQGRVRSRLEAPTPIEAGAEEVERTVVSMIRALRGRTTEHVLALGVAAAGFVAADRSTVSFAPNLEWRDHDLGAALALLTGLPTVVDNDANAAGWGEAHFGGGAGVSELLVLTLGTGLGGAIVTRSELLRGSQGMAGELGHLRIVPDGELCGCGQRGCWEQYASGTALTREARRLATLDPTSAALLLELAGGDPRNIGGRDVTTAARMGDPAALRLWSDLGTWVGVGVSNLAALLDPMVVVVAGGLALESDLFLPAARNELSRLLPGASHRTLPQLVPAALRDDAGLIGAADLARRHFMNLHPTAPTTGDTAA